MKNYFHALFCFLDTFNIVANIPIEFYLTWICFLTWYEELNVGRQKKKTEIDFIFADKASIVKYVNIIKQLLLELEVLADGKKLYFKIEIKWFLEIKHYQTFVGTYFSFR